MCVSFSQKVQYGPQGLGDKPIRGIKQQSQETFPPDYANVRAAQLADAKDRVAKLVLDYADPNQAARGIQNWLCLDELPSTPDQLEGDRFIIPALRGKQISRVIGWVDTAGDGIKVALDRLCKSVIFENSDWRFVKSFRINYLENNKIDMPKACRLGWSP